MKLDEIVVHMDNYNFTKLHQNRMKNKKVLLIAHFSVQNFKVSVVQWSFSLLFQFPREAGNYILIPAGMRVKCGKILYHNFIPKQGDFGPWIGSKMWKSQIFFKKGKNFLKIWKMMPIFLFIAFLILNFFQIWRNLRKFFFKKGKN